MKQIVFVSQVFYPDAMATSQLFTDLLRELAHKYEDDVKISVVCGYPSQSRAFESQEIPRHEIFDGIEIFRCGMAVDVKRSYVARALSYGSFLLGASRRILRLRKADEILGVTNPPFLAILLWALSLLGGFRYKYMLLDIYPEGLIALGDLAANSFIGRSWKALNGRSYRRAEQLIVLGRDMVPILRTYGVLPERITYIPHWSAAKITEPIPFAENPYAEKLSLKDRFVVQYSGNMGLWHDMDTFVRAAAELRDAEDIHFLFIGDGIRRAGAEKLAESLNLKNITWMDFVPRSELGKSLTCCHLALISLRTGLEGIAVPSKLYGILASGRGILAQVPADSEIGLVVEEEACGVAIEPGNARELANVIARLAADRTQVEQMGRNAFAAYGNKYTLTQAVAAFEALWGLSASSAAARSRAVPGANKPALPPFSVQKQTPA